MLLVRILGLLNKFEFGVQTNVSAIKKFELKSDGVLINHLIGFQQNLTGLMKKINDLILGSVEMKTHSPLGKHEKGNKI